MSDVNAFNESLKAKFNLFQEQHTRQQKKLKEAKVTKKTRLDTASKTVNNELNRHIETRESSFGIQDNLDLQLEVEDNKESYISEELIDHLNNEIRELRDESGRLKKLLAERELEIKQARKKKEVQDTVASLSGVTNDTAGAKIVELSKRIRELTSEVESEKTKCRILTKKCQDLELQIKSNTQSESPQKDEDSSPSREFNEDEKKQLQEKLHTSECKVSELRNNNALLKHEVKIAQKIISQEVGDGISIQSLMSAPGTWRGRAEQISLLNSKIVELKVQLDNYSVSDIDRDTESLCSRLSRQPTSQDKQREQLKKIEKERKEALQKVTDEKAAMETELNINKQKFEAAKARNKVLSGEVKALKQQMQTLIQKGHNDDELVSALMKQQSALRDLLTETQQSHAASSTETSKRVLQLSTQKQQDDAVVAQLKSIIEEKEIKLTQLEEDIQHIQLNKLEEAQKEGVQAIFNLHSSTSPQLDSNVSQNINKVEETSTPRDHRKPLTEKPKRTPTPRQQRPLSGRPPSSHRTPRNTPSPLRRQPSLEDRPSSTGNNIQSHAVYQAALVEKEKLTELVFVLQQRLEEANKAFLDNQNEAIQLKRKNALLEKKLSKLNLENATVTKRQNNTSKSTSLPNNKTEAEIEELNTKLLIQQDENTALKAALSSTITTKEQDLKLYSEMMESTRNVFLQALEGHANH